MLKLYKVEITEFVQAVTMTDAIQQARARNPKAAIIGAVESDEQQKADAPIEHIANVVNGRFTEEEKIRLELSAYNAVSRAQRNGLYGKLGQTWEMLK